MRGLRSPLTSEASSVTGSDRSRKIFHQKEAVCFFYFLKKINNCCDRLPEQHTTDSPVYDPRLLYKLYFELYFANNCMGTE